MSPVFGFSLGAPEIIVLLLLGVLLFGRRLPEVGRALGKTLVEFKKGVKGLEEDLEGSINAHHQPAPTSIEPPRPPQRVSASAPKFQDNAANVTAQPPQPPQA